MIDPKTFANSQAQALRTSADRFEMRGQSSTAIFFRNDAWRLEHDQNGIDPIKIHEERQDLSHGN